MSNLRSTPFDWGPPTGSAPGPVQGEASRGTDGQAVGSTPLHPRRGGDDSAKAGPSQGASPRPPPPDPFPLNTAGKCDKKPVKRSHSHAAHGYGLFTLYVCPQCKNHMTSHIIGVQ